VAAAVDAGPAEAAAVDLSALPAFVPADHEDGRSGIGLYDDATRSLDSFYREAPGVGSAYRAVVEQPSSVRARYLLACTLAASGKHDDAHAALGVLLAASHCPACVDTLLNVAHDTECSFDARDVALASRLVPSPLWTAANAVLDGLAVGKADALAPFLRARVAFTLRGDNCDRDCTRNITHTRAEIMALVRDPEAEDGERFARPTRLFCDHGCCEGPAPSHSHARIIHVDKLCFSAGARPTWTSLFGLQGG
jgi:hypothetical protein